MARASGLVASAAIGSLLLLGAPTVSAAQGAPEQPAQPVGRVVSFAPGSILGVVRNESGEPISGVVVSALGATTTFVVSDRNGRFEFGTLSPGPYVVRAHLSGYLAPRPEMIQVRASARATSSIALRRAGSSPPLLAAGIGGLAEEPQVVPAPDSRDTAEPPVTSSGDHGETAWRIGHARRGILKDVTIPDEFLAGGDDGPWTFVPADFLSRAMGSPARLATSFFADTAFSGQVNLLTTGSFDTPEQLFSAGSLSHNIAYVRVSAPVRDQADWTVRGALTQADISSWIIAGSYVTRAAARHRYDIGLSYSTQRYDGGNPLARHDVSDGSRNAGTVYGYDSFAIAPEVTLSYGGAYARYDYLDGRTLISPRLELTITPVDRLRVSGVVSRRALAPGAEEFLPPGDTGIWLPPQRTFSSIAPGTSLEAERTTHMAVAVERDFGSSTLAVHAFRQHIDDQLVTLFGTDLPQQPTAKVGHYFVGRAGDADASGYSAEFRTVLGGRGHGAIEYSSAKAQMTPGDDVRYLVLLAPSSVRGIPERIHDVATTIETTVPETATRVLVVYRISNAFARSAGSSASVSRPTLDGRFDVQVRQSLPFMNFSSAKWEMLLAVRNFFRETAADQSIYDELLVVRPPKRLVGGVTLHF
jgi:hypothetical protein